MKHARWMWAVLLLWMGCGTLQFEQVQLYDRYEQPASAEAVQEIVFSDAKGTLWSSVSECGTFEVSNKAAFSGKSSIMLTWDKSKGCEWLGFGNSFSNWTPADLSEQLQSKALSLRVRTIEGVASSLPIVACLEDFGGGGSYLFMDSKKYLRGLQMDTSWREMIVPLWDFPIREEEVDIASIKQAKFQLEGSGAFFLDEIKLIDFDKQAYQAMREEVEASKPKGSLPQRIYPIADFAFAAWGYQANPCQTLELRTTSDNQQVIHWGFEQADCKHRDWGINWNEWYAVNLRGLGTGAKLSIRARQSANSSWHLVLEDFAGHSLPLLPEYKAAEAEVERWHDLSIELPDLAAAGLATDRIRQLRFEGMMPGWVEIQSMIIEMK